MEFAEPPPRFDPLRNDCATLAEDPPLLLAMLVPDMYTRLVCIKM